jgi:hypothetical protein
MSIPDWIPALVVIVLVVVIVAAQQGIAPGRYRRYLSARRHRES